MSVFDPKNRSNHLESSAFLDEHGGVTIQRYESVKYPEFDKLTQMQLGYFWRPEEINLSADYSDFKKLNDHERFIIVSALSRAILLDSIASRGPSLTFLPIVSLPEIEAFILAWGFFESIHSRSYTHIIRNVFPNPSKTFDEILDIKEIVDCSLDVTKYYNELEKLTNIYKLFGEGIHTINDEKINVNLYELKKSLYMTIMSMNILEGIRFFSAFVLLFLFTESKKILEGNAKIIQFICRDEHVHLAGTQTLLKILPKEDEDFAKIALEMKDECAELFRQATEQEKVWSDYIFSKGSVIGLNHILLCEYLEWLCNKRMTAVKLNPIYNTKKGRENPLPWTQRWISSSEVQIANQETENNQYLIGELKNDLKEDTFNGMEL